MTNRTQEDLVGTNRENPQGLYYKERHKCEESLLLKAFSETKGNQSKCALKLGLSRGTTRKLLEVHQIPAKVFSIKLNTTKVVKYV